MNAMNDTCRFLGEPCEWQDIQVHLASLQGLWGGWLVHAFGSRDVVVRRISPVTRELRYHLRLPAQEFQALVEACIQNDLLNTPPPARPGQPDETMIQITLVNGRGEQQVVSKWAGDELPAFDAVARLLFALTSATHDLLPFCSGPFTWPAPDR